MRLLREMTFDAASAGDAFFDSVPAGAAVFALFPAPDSDPPSAPYLGRTRDLRRRLARLLRRPAPGSRFLNLREFTRRIEYQRVGSPFEAAWLLYLLNRRHYPRHYLARLRLKPPALLKLNLGNRFPRLYPTRRLRDDGSVYYGPFPSRIAAERLAAEFLDFFKIRRCVEDLAPDPAHPGCIYSQMQMCLAPCFAGCTDDDYAREVSRVAGFLDAPGASAVVRELESERAEASDALEFERAAKVHRRLEMLHAVLRTRPELARNLRDLDAVIVCRAARETSAAFFRVTAGEITGPAELSLDENVAAPVPLDEQIHAVLESLRPPERAAGALPPWEHLSLLAGWYYGTFREGEIVMLPAAGDVPYAKLVRVARKILSS